MAGDPFEEGLANAPQAAPRITQDDPFETGLASSPVTGKPVHKPASQASWMDTGIDAVKSLGTGLEQGAVGMIGSAVPGGTLAGQRAAGQTLSLLPQHTPETTTGEISQHIGQMAPGMIGGGPENLLLRAGTNVVMPALGEEVGKKTADALGAPKLEGAGEFLGAIAGGMSPNLLMRGITPLPAEAERLAAGQALRNEGVNISAGQVSGRPGLMAAESELGGGEARNAAQLRQFTRAVLQRAGINSDTADPATIDGAFNRIGNQFNVLGARNSLTVDRQMQQGLNNAVNRAQPSDLPIVQRHINDINAGAQLGQPLSGTVYQNLRSNLTDDIRSSSDYTRKNALYGIRNTLDDAMERSMQARGNTQDLAAWREARRQYRNMLVINRATGGGGSNAAQGFISPGQLRTADQAIAGRKAYNRGQSPFNDLARAGNSVMTQFPNSGTASRAWTRLLGATAGGLLGAHFGLPVEGLGTGALFAEAAGPWAMGRAVNSPFAQAYLGNQLMPHRLPLAGTRAGAISALTNPFLQKPSS